MTTPTDDERAEARGHVLERFAYPGRCVLCGWVPGQPDVTCDPAILNLSELVDPLAASERAADVLRASRKTAF